jgi:hypothetical protein
MEIAFLGVHINNVIFSSFQEVRCNDSETNLQSEAITHQMICFHSLRININILFAQKHISKIK